MGLQELILDAQGFTRCIDSLIEHARPLQRVCVLDESIDKPWRIGVGRFPVANGCLGGYFVHNGLQGDFAREDMCGSKVVQLIGRKGVGEGRGARHHIERLRYLALVVRHA